MSEDLVGGIVLGVTAMLLGPVVWWVTRLAATGRLGNNMLAGIRTSRTMASDEAWVVGHRAALPVAAKIAVIAAVLGAITVLLAALGATVAAPVVGLAAMGVVGLGAIPIVRTAHRAIDQAGL